MTEITGQAVLQERDELLRFVLGQGQLRGVAVSLDQSWQDACANHAYPPAITELLGECVAAALCMVATLKFDGRLILQFRGEGPVSLLVVQARSDLSFRVTAQWRDSLQGALLDQPLSVLLGQGQLALTLESRDGVRYQSLVSAEGAQIAEALEGYFSQSEQLPTRLVLAADPQRAVGILLQQVPGEGGTPAARAQAAEWEFDHASALMQTLTGEAGHQELCTTPVPVLLHRLFHQEALRLTQINPVRFHCGCSREGVGAMLRSLGAEELDQALADSEVPGYVAVHCEFCGTDYRFDAVDVAQLLRDDSVKPPDATRH
ncbi:Hsp33 family molecular chaperone HslO [Halothiobacillus sp. DCM-1]|uniref:Hsp33 family molecular chaperone HslO n=1 Tax=Halothiobacillus sp. DCM-1 TaxID=3112558 RepID=UPI003249D7B5